LSLTVAALLQGSPKGGPAMDVYPGDSIVTSASDSLLAVQEQLKQGKTLYKKKCQRCHELYSPKDYKLDIWKENLEEMKHKAELTTTEYNLILGYLAANCRKEN
jgi:cytochrome c5